MFSKTFPIFLFIQSDMSLLAFLQGRPPQEQRKKQKPPGKKHKKGKNKSHKSNITTDWTPVSAHESTSNCNVQTTGQDSEEDEVEDDSPLFNDDVSASVNGLMSISNVFHLFPLLPTEIRLLIWTQCFPPQRLISITLMELNRWYGWRWRAYPILEQVSTCRADG